MQIQDHIHSFNVEYDIFDGDNVLAVHIVETDEGRVQFGAGHQDTAQEVALIALDQGVDVIIAEHGDSDHYGGFPTIRQEFEREAESPPTFAIPAGDADWLREDGIRFDESLDPGTHYWGIKTIAAAGHTPGNMAYLYEDVLIAGDTLVGSDFGPIQGTDWSGQLGITPPSRNTGGDEKAQESVRKLLEYEFDTILVTHGSNVLKEGRTQVEKLVADLDNGIAREEF